MQTTVCAGTMLVGLVLAAANCGSNSHSCVDSYIVCSQTTIGVTTHEGTWPAGNYAISLSVAGSTTLCTLDLSDAPDGGTVQGTCAPGSNVLVTLQPQQSCPPVVCDDGGCHGMSCIPDPAELEMIIVLPAIDMQVGLTLSRDGTMLTSTTVVPLIATTEPKGSGCGTCTNGTAALFLP
jgi:hypothetical protein